MKYEQKVLIIANVTDFSPNNAETEILEQHEYWSGTNGGYCLDLTFDTADLIRDLRERKEDVRPEFVEFIQKAIADGVELLYFFGTGAVASDEE